MTERVTLAQRVERVEEAQRKLEEAQRATSRQVEFLTGLVQGIPGQVASQLDAQTSALKVALAESETRNADRITEVARQWPASSIVVVTAALALIVALAAVAVARALGWS